MTFSSIVKKHKDFFGVETDEQVDKIFEEFPVDKEDEELCKAEKESDN